MTNLFLLCGLALSLVGCAHPSQGQSTAALNCEPYARTTELLERSEGHVIVLGEMHGTNESPEAVEQIACAALSRGEKVRVGFEAVWSQGSALNAALDAPIDDDAMFEAAPLMWTTLDGRGTEAVLDLLKQIAAWRADGFEISVFAFDAMQEDWVDAASRDSAMAKYVDREISGFDGVVVLFTGNFHAQKRPFEFSSEMFVPMASLIRERPVFSLSMHHSGGEAWVNVTVEHDDGTVVESVGPLKMGPNGAAGAVERSINFDSELPDAYDGSYVTGPITPSAPAFPDRVSVGAD